MKGSKKYRRFVLFIGIVFFIASCEKEITIDMPQTETKIVIEGAIEEGQHPWVFVSKNAPFFDPVDSSVIANLLVWNAKVIVTDGVDTDSLHICIDPYCFPYIKYVSNNIIGQVGKTYRLKVQVGDKEYTATTGILPAVHLDSMIFKPDFNQDTLGFIWIYLKDPDTLGNYYRVFTKILGRDSVYLHPYPSVIDDKFFNGQYSEYSLEEGRNPLEDNLYDADGKDAQGVPRWYFRRGQTVVVKLCSMDAFHYDFWYSVEQQFITDGNPFASPVSVRTNINGGALGVWGGYGVFLDTIHIP
jgi:hypothetical protein